MIKQSTLAKYVGKVFSTTKSGDVVVLEVLGKGRCRIKFISSGNLKETPIGSVIRGEVRDLEAHNVCKVGVMDIKGYIQRGQPLPRDYSVWNGMIQRCYNENTREQFKAYSEVYVSEDFKVFSKFKGWYDKQIGVNNKDWHLDKDLLSSSLVKIYSEDTCVLLPPDINCAITNNKSVRGELPVGVIYNCNKTKYRARIQKATGWVSLGAHNTPEEAFFAYKKAKEGYIQELANKWKDQIDPRAYEALMNWEVEATN